MSVTGATRVKRIARGRLVVRWMTGAALLINAACVNISAPTKPIEINLNINVTQEVVYRLDNDAKSLIKQNPGIF
jgi:hypothetical protein